jgi:hypothetical protein
MVFDPAVMVRERCSQPLYRRAHRSDLVRTAAGVKYHESVQVDFRPCAGGFARVRRDDQRCLYRIEFLTQRIGVSFGINAGRSLAIGLGPRRAQSFLHCRPAACFGGQAPFEIPDKAA